MEAIGDFEYSKKDLIGHGAFAVVFKGRSRKKHDFIVAIKCITKKNLAKSQNLLSKEIKILKELSGLQHENVVALLDCKETSHHVFLVMEYCNGGDLADYLQAKGTLSEDTISLFFKQIAGAMKALNAKGIVHRDLKPQNILLCHTSRTHTATADTKLKIADFGFARFLQDGVMAATLCGSPMYMAPEVIMSLQYDAKADLWSVGTIMYQCLTGKAPFQAQTPQQLKQFYEKNANLQPNIPSGTSRELRHLLNHLLKRNAKERMEFDDYFRHPFLNPKPHSKSSSPVPVPRSRSRSSLSRSPSVKAVSASPLSGHMTPSPSTSTPRSKEAVSTTQEPMDTGSPQEVGGFLKLHKSPVAIATAAAATAVQKVDSTGEDYVMVPENSDHSAGSSARRPSSSADMPAFGDQSPAGCAVSKPVQVSPQSGNATYRHVESPCPPSPSRPSSLPVIGTPSTSPIPVPSQVKAYQQIQRSMGQSPSSPGIPQLTPSPASPSPRYQTQASPGVPIPRKQSTGSVPSVGSISPPTVQFSIGTPPSTWRRNSMGTPPMARAAGAPYPVSSSPLKRTGSAASPLPPIVGSPTKAGKAFQYPDSGHSDSPTSPLHTPFGTFHSRTKTCPDNIGAVGYSPDAKSLVPVTNINMDRCSTEPESLVQRSSSSSRLSDQLLRAAFGAQLPGAPVSPTMAGPGLPAQLAQSPPGRGMVVPYASGSTGSLNKIQPTKERSESFSGRQRTYSATDCSPSHVAAYAQSPGNMEGPITFVAPELVEDTLMDKTHTETVAKLNFVLALVECIIELAQSRSSPLSESLERPDLNNPATFTLEHGPFTPEAQRRLEQLVLYVRALQLLSSSIQLAKEEVARGRLQVHSSSAVKLILKDMNSYYHQCLAVCKHLHSKGLPENHPDLSPAAATITADKLIYTHAIEMCQTAALDELFGNPQECFRRYRNAQILLHSLAQQAQSDKDRDLLKKYKESVEKRLFNLHNQGYVQMNICDSTCSSS